MTDDQIELAVERLTDRLDERLMNDPGFSQESYDRLSRRVALWADTQYALPPTRRQPFSSWVFAQR